MSTWSSTTSDGPLIRTGMDASPNPKADKSRPPHGQEPNESWQLFDYGIGPHSAGILYQSSLGIVVKMDICLCLTLAVRGDTPTLEISEVIQNTPKLENVLVSTVLQTNSNRLLTDLELDEISENLNVGRWNLYGAMYGPPVIRNALWSVIKASFSKTLGAKFYFPEDRPNDIVLQTRSDTMQTCDPDTKAQYGLTRHLSEAYGVDFIGVFVVGVREMYHIVCILFDRKVPDSRHRAYKLIQVLIAKAADRGWGEYHARLALMDQIAETYSFNKNAQMKLNEKLKNTLYPKGILCPGKNGIWPANYRKED
ncbi:FAD-linked oxidase-like protein [Aspergillus minisclerotigenes]|uniref:FAD-linked oxidase-like protein n=1 Tax=Aspergillus minisclerotigenes TaxID=656917 RepID=A0A5N6JCT6_9EURO|nr:FAD-linked oxidase-like protein [Aspergillus minisclerotigenes]